MPQQNGNLKDCVLNKNSDNGTHEWNQQSEQGMRSDQGAQNHH
jgi:hypothetical protein